ncbi:uncharacterized protein LOC120315352 [Crotalus tigris]|uniref:uncharacterized protein LOC120315352 n=1 Tax=Crotalus tigris TaxID=88082 RepID=UPI00192F24CA|nr:uncharacterized protein LOC120315352 [Crotalus tigris]XP_039215508.1 uncharacterized protein LOC120315352 [Crotalus tigris]XP_039215509.1 uncharacterized protein LOC120315352 [Crotalus tigris]
MGHLTMSGPSPHKVTSIYLQKEEKNEIEEEDDEKSMKYLPPLYNPNLSQPTNVQIPIPPPLLAPVTQAQGAVRDGPYKVLVKELEQLKKDIKNFPFKDKPLQAFPLREVPNGVDGQGQARISFVHEPLKASELRAFKKEMKSMIEDPIGVAEQLDLLLGANIYTWDELGVIQSTLFTAEERQLIQRAARDIWTREHNPQAQRAILADAKFPLVRPNWDNNNAADRQNMEDMRVLLIRGIKEAVPKAQNMSKALMIEQKKEESPATFLQRLKDGMRKYSGTDPDDPANTLLVKIQFVVKSWPDISKKLQKLEGWTGKSIDDLLKAAQKVYVQRYM